MRIKKYMAIKIIPYKKKESEIHLLYNNLFVITMNAISKIEKSKY